MDIAQITEQYYKNNAEKLHKMVDAILKRYGGLSQKDIDDFYSLANEVFWIAVNDFNGNGDFNGFLYSRLARKIMSMITKRNRKKRADIEIVINDSGKKEIRYHQPLSLDAPINFERGDSVLTLGDVTESDFDLESATAENAGLRFSEDVNVYLKMLPIKTRKVALLISEGYAPCDIIEKIHITQKEYQIHVSIMQTYEYRKPMEWRYLR